MVTKKEIYCLECSACLLSVCRAPEFVASGIEIKIAAPQGYAFRSGLKSRLAYSPTRRNFYLLLEIPSYHLVDTYLLHCNESLVSLLSLDLENLVSADLDQAIGLCSFKAFFLPGVNLALDFFLSADNKKSDLIAVAINDDVLDHIFMTSPSIANLVKKLTPWREDALVSSFIQGLEYGMVNRVREMMLAGRSFSAVPKEAQKIMIKELFIKKDLPWSPRPF